MTGNKGHGKILYVKKRKADKYHNAGVGTQGLFEESVCCYRESPLFDALFP